MKKRILLAILPVVLLINHTRLALAATGIDCTGEDCINPLKSKGLAQPFTHYEEIEIFVKNIVKWLYSIFFVVAVFFFLLAAYNYMRGGTAGEEYIKTAKAQLKYGIIAVVVALVASGVALVIGTFLGVPTTQ